MEIHDTIAIFQIIITALAAIAASSGFWLFMERKRTGRELSNKLLIGLAYVRIVDLGMIYIERGNISQDEYDILCNYLYTPYIQLGGNGSIKRLMQEVDKLPISSQGTSMDHFKGVKDYDIK